MFDHLGSIDISINDFEITKNKLVTTLENWGEEFTVEFEILVEKVPSADWTNVFHFTTNGDGQYFGDRIPALFIHSYGFFYICSSLGPYPNYCTFYYFTMGKPYKIAIKQYEEADDEYWFEIIIDGETKFKHRNDQVYSYPSVDLYASDNWYSSFTDDFGKVTNFRAVDSGR